jgi:hypothetical protein
MSSTMEGNKTRKNQWNYKGHGNELKRKEDPQRIPLMNANGRLNNKQIALKGVVTKEKRNHGA